MLPRPESEADVEVIPVWLETVVAKVGEVDTCMVYDAASADAVQLSASEVLSPVAPFSGAASTGAIGAAMFIVKLQAFVHALVPPGLVALTCQ